MITDEKWKNVGEMLADLLRLMEETEHFGMDCLLWLRFKDGKWSLTPTTGVV